MSTFRRLIMAAMAALLSCFAKGYWSKDEPWTGNEGWKK